MEIDGYRIVRELGRGGMGVVFEAVDSRTQRRVALKTVGRAISRRGLERLRREAEALQRLQHPGLVPCYGSGVSDVGVYVVMALVEGTSLEELLQREGPLPLGRALRTLQDVGEALAYVHAQGLVHRDVKPANVLLSSSGRVVLSDFGLVKGSPELFAVSQADLTRSGAMLGTPGYMPPEQAFGRLEQVGVASDVYGWAATLYALLAGHPPRTGESLVEVLASFDRPVPPLRGLRDEVPAWLDRLLARCLATDPAERPSLSEALRELHRFGREAQRPAARARRALGIGLALLALGALAGGLVWALGSGDPASVAGPAGGLLGDWPPRYRELEAHLVHGRVEEADALAVEWIAREPMSRWALAAATRVCTKRGRREESLGYGERLVRRFPDDAGAWHHYAEALVVGRDYDAAVDAAARAHALAPEEPEVTRLYAITLRHAKRYAESLAVTDALLARGPRTPRLLHDRAMLLGVLDRPREAIAALDEALELGPKNPAALLWARGSLELELDEPSGVDDLLASLEGGHQAPSALARLAPYWVRHEEPQALLAFLDRHLPDSEEPEVVRWRCRALLGLGRGEEALPLCVGLMSDEQTAPHAILFARALAQDGRAEEALTLLERVCAQLQPSHPGYAAANRWAVQVAALNPGLDRAAQRGEQALQSWLYALRIQAALGGR